MIFNLSKKREREKNLLRNSLVLLMAVYNIAGKDFTETEKKFFRRALYNIAEVIAKI